MELSDDFIDELLAQPATRRRKYDPNDVTVAENRHILVWVRLQHRLGICSNSECPDVRPLRVEEGNAMVTALPNNLYACRICYLAGFGLDK